MDTQEQTIILWLTLGHHISVSVDMIDGIYPGLLVGFSAVIILFVLEKVIYYKSIL